jgi:hypothetical protein
LATLEALAQAGHTQSFIAEAPALLRGLKKA